ncbi:transposase [Klebsiella pneumoniae]|nr:transposase [Klebsiella pneumoniae]
MKVPQVRGMEFYPSCIEKGMRSERALKLAIAEMYVKGVSTRRGLGYRRNSLWHRSQLVPGQQAGKGAR